MKKIYEKEGVQFYGEVSTYHSCLNENSYKVINGFEIFKDGELVYKNFLNDFLLDRRGIFYYINFEDWKNQIAYFIKHSEAGTLEFKKVLDSFFMGYDNFLLENTVRKLKTIQAEKERRESYIKNNKKLEFLQRKLKKVLNDKLVYNSSSMYIITDDFKEYLSKNYANYNIKGNEVIEDLKKSTANNLKMAVEKEIKLAPTTEEAIRQCEELITRLQ